MTQKFENQFTNKKIIPNNYLDQVFCMYKGGNPKSLKLNSSNFVDFVQVFGPVKYNLLFNVGLQHLKQK